MEKFSRLHRCGPSRSLSSPAPAGGRETFISAEVDENPIALLRGRNILHGGRNGRVSNTPRLDFSLPSDVCLSPGEIPPMLFVFWWWALLKSPLRILRPSRRLDWPFALEESLKLLPPRCREPPEAAPVPAVGETCVLFQGWKLSF